MRTTVNLPPAVHRRAQEIAARRGQPLSTVLADLTIRGLAQLDEPVDLAVDERTGLPVLSIGRRVTTAEVAEILDDERSEEHTSELQSRGHLVCRLLLEKKKT